jgi:large subunit ribosomal protein L20
MSRVKGGVTTKHRHKRLLKAVKGYRGARGTLYRVAREAAERSWAYAYRDRKQRKRDFRRLWIVRINAAARQYGLSYSRLMDGLSKAQVEIDRKVLADMAVSDQAAFARLAEVAKAAV